MNQRNTALHFVISALDQQVWGTGFSSPKIEDPDLEQGIRSGFLISRSMLIG